MKQDEQQVFEKWRSMCRILAAGGIFHDLGKFAERAGDVPPCDKDTVQQEYRYGHAHATEVALEQLFNESCQTGSREDETFINLACRHHRPRNYPEQIIQVADWWASGHERAHADETAKQYDTEGRERKRQIPLVSILGRIQLDDMHAQSPDDWRYLLRAGTVREGAALDDLFPKHKDEYTHQDVQEDYKALWKEFLAVLDTSSSTLPFHPLEHLETLFEICRTFQWCLPASTRLNEMPDVSLFEHAKATAAIASCLYQYHASRNELENLSALQEENSPKFLLFCADIAGIQGFIYRISSKGAYKLLKGRSFYVQLLSEVIARHLVHELGLTVANILYASGGKCYLLLSNTPQTQARLDSILSRLNVELFEQFNGDLHLRSGHKELAGADLCWKKGHRPLDEIWDDLARELAASDRQRFTELMPGDFYDTVFNVSPSYEHGTCEVCHATTDKSENTRCEVCRSLEELGSSLGKARCIVVGAEKSALPGKKAVLELPLGYHVWCLEKEPSELAADSLVLWSLNSDDFMNLAKNERIRRHAPCAPLMLGSNHRFNKDFESIAKMSKGIERLGILRMDVDNLGRIFSQGLKNYRHQGNEQDGRFHSLARITTLSWQLRIFFEGVLPRLLEPELCDNNKRITVVYSGGDDLFLLGAWDALPEAALLIREKFRAFCCQNPCFSLSGGLVLSGGRFPVYKSADMAGEAEAQAKAHETSFSDGHTARKSAFTFMETPMHWGEFEQVKQQKDQLLAVLDGRTSWPLLRRLREIAASWLESRQRIKNRNPHLSMQEIAAELQAERWRWRMVYSLSRQAERDRTLEPTLKRLQEFIVNDVEPGTRGGIELLHVLVRWVEYINRDSKN